MSLFIRKLIKTLQTYSMSFKNINLNGIAKTSFLFRLTTLLCIITLIIMFIL